jgi:hypothetical protein
MSFMFLTCAWCGEDYTFGIVGTSMVGSGHSCTATVPCDTDGCDEPARWLVADERNRGDTESIVFSCKRHIGDCVIVGSQPRPYEEES